MIIGPIKNIFRKNIRFMTTNVINFNKYHWLKNLESKEAQEAIRKAQDDIKKNGIVLFPEIITQEALADCIDESNTNLNKINKKENVNNVYNLKNDNKYSQDHIRNKQFITNTNLITTNNLDAKKSLGQLYLSAELLSMIKKVTNSILYVSTDSKLKYVINVLDDKSQTAWHFDKYVPIITLMIQKPDFGGKFRLSKYPIDLNLPYDYKFEIIDDIVSKNKNINEYDIEPGTLTIFNGKKHLHCVTPVIGSKNRVVSIFTYSKTPNLTYSSFMHKMFLGIDDSTKNK